ncbi:bifunctional glutamate--cysteine ligase GshA/glutathione synthetase GshB [Schinkia sp. CFF1]
MNLLDENLINKLMERNLNEAVFQGKFGLEKENVRVDQEGKLALTPHPKAFGSKKTNPYIKTDFSESQIEMITPAFDTIEETYNFLETLHDIVTLELELQNEFLWPSSNPPILPSEDEIPIADMEDDKENEYRLNLAQKYGRKKQLVSGIHFNFSFSELFLRTLYDGEKSFRDFKDEVYLKVARNFLKYRWLLIYLTGVSPIFHQTYAEKCVQIGKHFDDESYYFPHMNSLRNSQCGYRNQKPIYVSFHSIEEYVQDIENLVRSQQLLSAKEFYSAVRLKVAGEKDQLQGLLEHGIAYLELRTTDLNPFYKIGISKDTMSFIHLFLIYMLLIKDEPFGEEEQRVAQLNQDALTMDGITTKLQLEDNRNVSMQETGLQVVENMKDLIQLLAPSHLDEYISLLEHTKGILLDPALSFAERLKMEIQNFSFLTYHLDKAREYAVESTNTGYKFTGYEDLELSTQLLLKAAMKRGIQFELIDREDNFILLKKDGHQEYVKQATKTSLDSYVTVLIMENKIVTKKVLKEHGIRVPDGNVYHNVAEAMTDFYIHHGTPIVIKPKSTNFGLGITIFTSDYTKEDYQKAFEMAFEHDKTVLLEEFITGKEYRFLVMGDEVVGVLHRVPANVVGDGIHSIKQLISEKNKDPLRGSGYKTPLEFIQLGEVEKMFLKNQGKCENDIPKFGETVYLRENSNISTGGDSIDFTDEIPDSYKQIAIRSAKAAGAVFCGVDMVIDDSRKEAGVMNYGIIEINFNPAIHIHCYPYKGKNRKADDKILDLLFGSI